MMSREIIKKNEVLILLIQIDINAYEVKRE